MHSSSLCSLSAVLSSSLLSFVAGQSLSYVVAASSGAVTAVPLAIFVVSTVVALISVMHLMKLVISSSEVDFDKKEELLNSRKTSSIKIVKGLTGEFLYKEDNSTNRNRLPELTLDAILSQIDVVGSDKTLNNSEIVRPLPPPPLPIQINFPTTIREDGIKKDKVNSHFKKHDSDFYADLAKAVKDPKLRRVSLDDIISGKDSKTSDVKLKIEDKNKRKTSEDIDRIITSCKEKKKKEQKEQTENNPLFKKMLQIRSFYSDSEGDHESGLSDGEWEDEQKEKEEIKGSISNNIPDVRLKDFKSSSISNNIPDVRLKDFKSRSIDRIDEEDVEKIERSLDIDVINSKSTSSINNRNIVNNASSSSRFHLESHLERSKSTESGYRSDDNLKCQGEGTSLPLPKTKMKGSLDACQVISLKKPLELFSPAE